MTKCGVALWRIVTYTLTWERCATSLLNWTCVGIHPQRVELASPILLTISPGKPGSAVLCEVTRHFHPVLSPSCAAKDSRCGERLKVGLDHGSPCLQLASSLSAPRARRCGKEKVTFGASCSITKPAEPSLHEHCRHTIAVQLRYGLADWQESEKVQGFQFGQSSRTNHSPSLVSLIDVSLQRRNDLPGLLWIPL